MDKSTKHLPRESLGDSNNSETTEDYKYFKVDGFKISFEHVNSWADITPTSTYPKKDIQDTFWHFWDNF